MSQKTEKWKTVGFSADADFPITGKQVKRLLEFLWVLPIAVNNPEQYEAWCKLNPADEELLITVITWSQSQHQRGKTAEVLKNGNPE